jgi:hypothetical protein
MMRHRTVSVDQFGANRMIWHSIGRGACAYQAAQRRSGVRAARAGVMLRRIDELANLRHLVTEAAMRHSAGSDY